MFVKKISRLLGVSLLILSSLSAASPVETSENQNEISIKNEYLELSIDLAQSQYNIKNIKTAQIVVSKAGVAIGFSPLDDENYKTKQAGQASSYKVIEISNELGKGKQVALSINDSKNTCIKRYFFEVYDGKPYVVMGFGLENKGSDPLTVYHATPLCDAELFEGVALTNPQSLNGGAGDNETKVLNSASNRNLNSMMLTGKQDGERKTIVAGGLTYQDFIREVEIADTNGKISMNVFSWDPVGRRVDPGSSYDCPDKLYIDCTTVNPFESLEYYAFQLRDINHVELNYFNFPTFCGWAMANPKLGDGGDWNHSSGLVQLAEAQKDGVLARYTPIAMRLEPDTYPHKSNHGNSTSQGWWDDEHYRKHGKLTAPYDTFKSFCDGLAKTGAIPFSYVQVNMLDRDFAKAHPDWWMAGGEKLLDEKYSKHAPFRMDYTDVEFQKYMVGVWKRWANDGLKGIKHDYPQTGWFPNGGFDDPYATATSAYRTWFQLCREGLGPKAYIHERNLSRVNDGAMLPLMDATIGICDLQRVSKDNSHIEPDMFVKMALRWYKNRVVMNYYPDGKAMMHGETPLTDEIRRTTLTLTTLISGRLEMSTPYTKMTPKTIRDLTRVFPVLTTPKSMRPVDMLMGKDRPEIYAYDVTPSWSQVLLFNTDSSGKEGRAISVPFSGDQADTGSLGLKADKNYYVYDFWNDRFVGQFKGAETFSIKLNPLQALIFSVHEVVDHPQFISTDRHILQGQMELSDVKWNDESKALTGKAELIENDPMVITIACNGLTPQSVNTDKGTEVLMKNDEKTGLCKIELSNKETQQVSWSLQF